MRPERGRGPLFAVHVVDGDEGRLAAHGEANVTRIELTVDAIAELQDGVPLIVTIGFGDARILVNPGDAHLVLELDLARAHLAGDGRGGVRLWRGCQRNVTLAGEQARRGIEPDPARAGQIDLGPGVKIGEIDICAGWAVERLDVGL